jgi:hypothetical protein
MPPQRILLKMKPWRKRVLSIVGAIILIAGCVGFLRDVWKSFSYDDANPGKRVTVGSLHFQTEDISMSYQVSWPTIASLLVGGVLSWWCATRYAKFP